MGLLRMSIDRLNAGRNRDGKGGITLAAWDQIDWLFHNEPLPPNILLQLPPEVVDEIMSLHSGQQRFNELFRRTLGMRVERGVIATVAQQDDYMKRVRYNGGARSTLRDEGIVILGQYRSHQAVARDLGLPIPGKGESISARIVPTTKDDGPYAEIDGELWRVAREDDSTVKTPKLPER